MGRTAFLPRRRADTLAAQLPLLVDSAPVCLACLSIVAFQLPDADRRVLQGSLVSVTRDLWAEGLAEYAFAALEEARRRGVEDAVAGLADLEALGGSSPIARAITLRLARQLLGQARQASGVRAIARERLDSTRPELN